MDPFPRSEVKKRGLEYLFSAAKKLAELHIEQRPHRKVARRHRAHRRIARHVDVLDLADDPRELPCLLRGRQVLRRDRGQRLRVSIDGEAGIGAVRDSLVKAVSIKPSLFDQIPCPSVRARSTTGAFT